MSSPSVILGITNTNVSGASLLVDGQVLASVNEERFSRVKNQRTFPHQSIRYCLESASLELKDVDQVACGAWGGVDDLFVPQVLEEVMEAVQRDPQARPLILRRCQVAVERDDFYKRELLDNLRDLGVPGQRISLYDHHLSHAYTAFYPSPFDQALVVTLDGRGDFKSATVSRASRREGLKLLDSVSMFSSLGVFYSFITRYLGFTPDKHEGKVTGLAAFGDPRVCLDTLRKMIAYEGRVRSRLGRHYTPFITGSVPEIEAALAGKSREDIAAAVQYLLEEIVLAYLTPFLRATGLRQVCLAGGVFANVALNRRIMALDEVDNIYVFPQMGDGGNAFGGALIKLYEQGGSFASPLEHVYLGPSFSTAQVVEAAGRYPGSLKVSELKDYTLARVAADLEQGAVVGLFSGRMEYGPRALGARTILARPTDPEINKVLNARLSRTEFMPFAPVTLEEEAASYYLGWRPDHIASRFMTNCYLCSERARRQAPAIVHVDNTARPQVIGRRHLPLYYDILSQYHRLTGIPTLINTSFNNHEEPIVCSPRDAIESLLRDNIDYLVTDELVLKPAGKD